MSQALRFYAIRLRPTQSLIEFGCFIRFAFKAELVGIDSVDGLLYVKLDARWRGQFESAMSGRFPPFEGVESIESVDLA